MQPHARPSTNSLLKQHFELTDAQEAKPDAVQRLDWLERSLPSAVTHRDALEATMKKAASNAGNPRKAAVLDESVLGWSLVASSCYQWMDTDIRTRKRKHEVVAMAAIFELALTRKYRPKLLARSSIAHLRLSLTKILKSHSKTGDWEFSDGFAPDWSKVPDGTETVPAAVDKVPPVDKSHMGFIKIIQAVETSPMASANDSPDGRIDGHVSEALYQLVLVSFPPLFQLQLMC
jgi:hypothetical protein